VSLLDLALLLAAALAAGVLNAVAGGGTFLTFPALVAVGVPPVMANATSSLAAIPGYAGGSLGFKSELQELPRHVLKIEVAVAVVAGLIGAGLLLVTPDRLFGGLVPWLLGLATALFALGPRLSRMGKHGSPLTQWRLPGLFVVCVYGGYFNGGLGILLMALYGATGETRINTANGLKSLISLVLALASVAAFAAAGSVDWKAAPIMMVGTALGGYWGAKWAKRLPSAWVRAVVVITGVVMTAIFFLRAA